MKFSHDLIEKNSGLLILLVILTVSVGGLVEILPLYFQKSTTEPVAGIKPYTAMQLAGRDIYLREGCYNCHSQMIRPFRAETERYGHYSMAGEFVYDHPFQWGSKRTGPDLHRVGGRYSDEWHRLHLNNPRDLVPESNMPAYPWLAGNKLDPLELAPKMRALRMVGVPYTDAEIAAAEKDVAGKNELDAVIAYLQVLGTAIKSRGVPMPAAGIAAGAPVAGAPAAAAAAPAASVTPNPQR
jgi:cytochrome c oxidase cbb3-type subunit 2